MAKPSEVQGLGLKTPIAKSGMALVSARLADVNQHQQRLGARPSQDAVHRTRVSTRRLRCAIHLFGKKALRRHQAQVKAFQDALGHVRDIQLQIQWLQSQPGARRTALRPILIEQRQALLAAARELRGRVSHWRNQTAPALAKLMLSAVRSKGRLGGARMRRRLKKKLAQTVPELEGFDEAKDALTLHRLRIALKKHRYDVELLELAFPAYAGLALSVLAPLQSELGSVHDKDVRLELLSRFSAKASDRHRAEIEALLSEILASRRQEVEGLSKKIGWLVLEKIPDRLRRLLD